MKIMECRHSQLEDALNGLNETDIPLVAFNNISFSPAGHADDLGIYYFIPWISKTLGVSIDSAINIFFGSLLLAGAVISLLCFFLAFKHWGSRLISCIGLGLLTYASYRYSDVYIAPFFATACIVPVFILWNQYPCKRNWKLILGLAFSGLLIGYCNIIRSYSGTGALIFILAWLFVSEELQKKQKLLSLLLVIGFTCIPYLHLNILETNRDNFILKINPHHKPTSIVHPKWHSIYIGFGYLKNKYGLSYSDSVSYDKAISINPKVVYCSDEYEQILRDQCILLAISDPIFVIKTIFSKAILLLLNFLIFSNFGLLIALWYVKPSFRYLAPFVAAALFYSLPGILVLPVNAYTSGAASIATLFGISMICLGIEKYARIRAESFMPM